MCHYEAAMDKTGEDFHEYKTSEIYLRVMHMAAIRKPFWI